MKIFHGPWFCLLCLISGSIYYDVPESMVAFYHLCLIFIQKALKLWCKLLFFCLQFYLLCLIFGSAYYVQSLGFLLLFLIYGSIYYDVLKSLVGLVFIYDKLIWFLLLFKRFGLNGFIMFKRFSIFIMNKLFGLVSMPRNQTEPSSLLLLGTKEQQVSSLMGH